MRGFWTLLLAVPVLSFVAGCGGGGGASGGASPALPGLVSAATPVPGGTPLPGLTPTPAATTAASPVGAGLAGSNALTIELPAGLTSAAFDIVSLNLAAPGPSAVPVALTFTYAAPAARIRAGAARVNALGIAVVPPAHPVADHPYGRLDGRHPSYVPIRLPGAAPSVVAARRAASALAVGAQRTFYVDAAPIGTQAVSYLPVPFTLVAVTAHVNVWMQTAIAASFASRVTALATDAETALGADVANFGPVTYDATATALAHRYAYCDSSGAPSGGGGFLYIPPYTAVNLLLVDPSQLDGSVGGDFSATDLLVQGVANCFGAKSNEAPTLTLGLSTAYTNLDYFVLTTSAHEFAHLAQFVTQNVILGRTGAAPGTIEEGLAELARDYVLGQPDYGNIYQNVATEFLEHPETYSILGMDGFEDGTFSPYRYGNYGAAYLLMRYTADRYGTGFVKAYLQSDPLAGAQRSFAALAAAAGAASFAQLFEDFGTMLAANADGLPNVSPTNLTSFSLRGNYTGPNAFYASSRYIMNGVASGAAVPANASVPMYAGGLAIVSANGAIGGATFTATDASGTLLPVGAYAGH